MKRYRWRQNGIAGNIFLGKYPSKIALVAPGLPYVPGMQEYFLDLVEAGYAILQPQYIGTYDSEGLFSPNSAIDTIKFTLSELRQGIYDVKSGKLLTSGEVDLTIAHSFGTWVVVNSINLFKDSTPIVLLSPFLAMGKYKHDAGVVVDLSNQANYISSALPLTFRFSEKTIWEEFFRNGNFPPVPEHYVSEKRILCVVGSEDAAFDIKTFREAVSIYEKAAASFVLRVVKGAGHDATEIFKGAKVIETIGGNEKRKVDKKRA